MNKNFLVVFGLICGAPLVAQSNVIASWTSAAPAAPQKFEPAVVAKSDTEESMLTVSPSGTELFWGVSRVWFPMSRVSEIWTARREGSQWKSERASFSIGYSDGDPFASYDGRQVFFASVRPVGPPRKDFDLYVVDRTESGYSRARNLGKAVNSPEDELYPSVASDGTLYFGSDRSGTWHIYRAVRAADGSYGAAEALPLPINDPNVWSFNPFVSADGKTLLFTSLNRKGGFGKGDIWVASADAAGNFGTVRNLGPTVNTAEEEFHPTMSHDRRALFFVRRNTSSPGGNADVHWVKAAGLLLNSPAGELSAKPK